MQVIDLLVNSEVSAGTPASVGSFSGCNQGIFLLKLSFQVP